MNRSAIVLFAVATCLTACSAPKRYRNPSPNHIAIVRVWVEQNKNLPPDLVISGCEMWKDKGVQCVLVPHKDQGSVRVVPALRTCARSPNGVTTLAYANPGGEISVVIDCFTNDKNVLDRTMFRSVLGHEIGHQFGIWNHVPQKCEKGVAVCGDALMNPHYEEKIDFITPADSLAFDARELKWAVITNDGEKSRFNAPQNHEVKGCVYTRVEPAPKFPHPFFFIK